jgi:precorrin-8X/cobalt-precorrin-8 methylmutase
MHITDARGLALIDRTIETPSLAPAEYEIVRRVILATADFEYRSLVHFSDRALAVGAAALAARSPIVVDVPMVQVGIIPHLQETFANPVYCGTETITRPQKNNTKAEQRLQVLARRYREGIFVVGQSPIALIALLDLMEIGEVQPALAIVTPASLIETNVDKERLRDSQVPHISIEGMKGNAVVAVAIVNALVELAWQAYRPDRAITFR